MGNPPVNSQDPLICDSSLLINFLRIDKLDLLSTLTANLLIVDVVREEIKRRYQLEILEAAIARQDIAVVSRSAVEDLALVGQLRASGLGDGESASIVAAQHFSATLGIDDRAATKRACAMFPKLAILTTKDIIVNHIRAGVLTIAQADAIKAEWAKNQRFTLPFNSFGEVLQIGVSDKSLEME